MKLSSIRIDTDKANEGVEVEYGEGLTLLLARPGGPAYQDFLMERTPGAGSGFRGNKKGQGIQMKALRPIMQEAASKFVLLGWDGLEDDNGEPIEYSQAKALELFRDPTLPTFYDEVMALAGNEDLYRLQATEDASGN